MPRSSHRFRNHLFVFDKGALALHKNLMPCVIVSRRNPVIVANKRDRVESNIVAINPGAEHSVTVKTGGADIVYLDGINMAPSPVGFQSLSSDWHALPLAFEDDNSAAIIKYRQRLHIRREPPDQSILKIVTQLYDDPFTRMSQTDLAQQLGLERTQALRHFKATTGQTFRKFKLWAGIVAATHYAMNGTSIGLAGLETGFSDPAHLTRAAGTVFGITPTQGLSGLKRLQTLEERDSPTVRYDSV